jgi:hypothetical protein
MSALAWPLRLLALTGPAVVLLWQVVTLPPLLPRQDVCFVALFVLAFCVALSLLVVRASRTLLRHGDLLVPLGLYTAAVPLANVVLALPALAALTAPSWSGQVLGLGMSLSAALVVQVVLAVFYGGWTTRLIVQAADTGRTDLIGALARPWRWFGRVSVAEAIGWGVLMLLMLPALALAHAALAPGLLLIGVTSLVWNLATAALLPVVVASRRPLGAALANGFRASWEYKGRWWYVVVVQMLLLGWVTFLSVSFTSSNGPGNVTTKSNTNWGVNGFWTGGYENNSRWYAKVAEIYETQPLAPVTTLVDLLFGLLAIAVKVRIAGALWPVPVFDTREDESEAVEGRPGAPRPGCVAAACFTAGLFVLGLVVAVAFHQTIADELLLWQMHRAAERGEPLEPFANQVAQHNDAVDVAARLSEDGDPRVRRQMIPVLVGNASPAKKKERRFGIFAESWNGLNSTAIPALSRLLDDPDPDVRREALRTVSGLRAMGDFEMPLRKVLRAGDLEDRVIVAESLAHWEFGRDFRETFADRNQPKEVRLAVVRGAEKYGWYEAARKDDDFIDTLAKVMDDPDAELRHAAIRANAQRTDHLVADTCAAIAEGNRDDDRRVALDAWIDALVNEGTLGGDSYQILESTESLMFRVGPNTSGAWPERDGRLDAGRLALLIYVVCEAARRNTAALDREPPVNAMQAMAEQQRGGGPTAAAFVVELHRLEQTLRALAAVRRFLAYPQTRTAKFRGWLPQEVPNGAPPTRTMKDFLLEQAREPLAWCRKHGNGYGSQFLRVNGFWFMIDDGGLRPGQARTLGQVLQDMKLDTDKALAEFCHFDTPK